MKKWVLGVVAVVAVVAALAGGSGSNEREAVIIPPITDSMTHE